MLEPFEPHLRQQHSQRLSEMYSNRLLEPACCHGRESGIRGVVCKASILICTSRLWVALKQRGNRSVVTHAEQLKDIDG